MQEYMNCEFNLWEKIVKGVEKDNSVIAGGLIVKIAVVIIIRFGVTQSHDVMMSKIF